MIRSYADLSRLKTFDERFDYLKLTGRVGEETFGRDRYLNQLLYESPDWKSVRDKVIIRDNGCDLGIDGMEIRYCIFVHHMNPITVQDVLEHRPEVYDPEFLICCSRETHNAIHYGDKTLLSGRQIIRTPYDTCPWR